MRYYLDTEFIDTGRNIDLISIGLVAEDGREYYAVSKEFEMCDIHEWLWKNVMPHLPKFGDPAWKDRREIKTDLLDFCDPQEYGSPEFWAWFGAYDWVVFCQIFGPMSNIPKGFPMFVRDIRQYAGILGNPTIMVDKNKIPGYTKSDKAQHDALADARWNKQAHEWLMDLEERLARAR